MRGQDSDIIRLPVASSSRVPVVTYTSASNPSHITYRRRLSGSFCCVPGSCRASLCIVRGWLVGQRGRVVYIHRTLCLGKGKQYLYTVEKAYGPLRVIP